MPTAFEHWFATEFERRINTVKGRPGDLTSGLPIEQASWDRRAAYLLWQAIGDQPPPPPSPTDAFQDLFG